MDKVIAAIALVVGFLIIVVAFACLLAWPVMLLWNGCLVGAVDGVHNIGFWQAMGLMILSGLLFKSSSSKCKAS